MLNGNDHIIKSLEDEQRENYLKERQEEDEDSDELMDGEVEVASDDADEEYGKGSK